MATLTSVLRLNYIHNPGWGKVKNCCVTQCRFASSRVRRKPIHKSVSHFIDSLRIQVKGGPGGHGYPQKGGLGGRGGDVFVYGDPEMTLKELTRNNPSRRFAAGPGSNARLFCTFGEEGKSLRIPVPLGITVLSEEGHKIGEINEPKQKVVVAKGGDGGNEMNGYSAQAGQTHMVKLDLKIIADVGFVGFPNAGKSTLLKALSRARPKIASYPFTTIRPNIGVIEFPDTRQISLADLPGLIEGAHANEGMGHKFLKHAERTLMLLFVVDLHGFQLGPKYPLRTALETIVLLNRELELYLPDLTAKPTILALNKSDIPNSYPIVDEIRDLLNDKEKYVKFIESLPPEFQPEYIMHFDNIVPISALNDRNSIDVLKRHIRKCLDVSARDEVE